MDACARLYVCYLMWINADLRPAYLNRYRTTLLAGRPKICGSNSGGSIDIFPLLTFQTVTGPRIFIGTSLCIYFQKAKIQGTENQYKKQQQAVQSRQCAAKERTIVTSLLFILRRKKLTYFYSYDLRSGHIPIGYFFQFLCLIYDVIWHSYVRASRI